MLKYCANKLRINAGKIMSETSGDKLRNYIADGFIDTARALEKLDAPIEKIAKTQCFWYAAIGGFVGASSVLVAILLLR